MIGVCNTYIIHRSTIGCSSMPHRTQSYSLSRDQPRSGMSARGGHHRTVSRGLSSSSVYDLVSRGDGIAGGQHGDAFEDEAEAVNGFRSVQWSETADRSSQQMILSPFFFVRFISSQSFFYPSPRGGQQVLSAGAPPVEQGQHARHVQSGQVVPLLSPGQPGGQE